MRTRRFALALAALAAVLATSAGAYAASSHMSPGTSGGMVSATPLPPTPPIGDTSGGLTSGLVKLPGGH